MKIFIKRVLDWQHWPFGVFYFPLYFSWIYYCIKSGSFWFFSASNPTLTFGGFEGESKSEMYGQLPKDLYPKTIYIEPEETFEQMLFRIKASCFSYPFIVKPDIGMKGILFRKIENEEQLKQYHLQVKVRFIIQEFIEWPLEISVFYYRYPDQKTGHISAIIQKDLLTVKGDGHSSLRELMSKAVLSKKYVSTLSIQYSNQLEMILQPGETFILSLVANRMYGAEFRNHPEQINKNLLLLFDDLSHYAGGFYYGRYDIKCNSIEELCAGKNFSILEFNGAGSIPNHIYTGDYTLIQAYKEIIKHWKILYTISRYNHKNGTPYWSFWKGLVFLQNTKRYFRLLDK